MDADIVLESVLYASPWLLVAALFYAIAWWKKRRGKDLFSEARELLAAGQVREARESLLSALSSANEEPQLESAILAELERCCTESSASICFEDYRALISQYQRLSRKGSHKALSELKQVQSAKSQLIGRMRKAA